ncbi:hypothetical protein [Rossellomorea aquimaris]|uniref:hypothetical protein n=1 Tax=Rossellomorea aquimaris TaxID=189382 RepID=UPI0007D0476F|nr:hypothetical protein [Rossellomorea aquimaris]
MSILVAFLPILFIIVLALVIPVIYRKGGLFTGWKTKWIFIAYFCILIVSVPIAYLLPEKESAYGEKLTDEEIKQLNKDREAFFEDAMNGKIKEGEGTVLKKEWEFKVDESRLTISNFTVNMFILAKRTESNDQRIKVDYYTSKSIVHRIDVTDKLSSPTITFYDNQLVVHDPEHVEIKLASFTNEFITNQFKNDSQDNYEYGSSLGGDLLLLSIPQGVEVEGDIEFIE